MPDEDARLTALRRLKILDTPAEPAYDEIVQLASHICRTPIALISFIDRDLQWFKARHGVAIKEMPRDISFCSHAISQPDLTKILHISDARQDDRFMDNPLVVQGPGIRFYAGIPLVTVEGAAVGTLCVVDRVPRELDPAQMQALRVLGRGVMAQLQMPRPGNSSPRPIDAESLLQRCGGQTSQVEKLLSNFHEQIGAQVNALWQELGRRDARTLARLAQSIEDSAAGVAAEPLRASAAELEARVLANDFAAAADCLRQVETSARDCIDYLPTAAAAVKRSTGK